LDFGPRYKSKVQVNRARLVAILIIFVAVVEELVLQFPVLQLLLLLQQLLLGATAVRLCHCPGLGF
jgi:hypothetical protein